jgi:hypothetical protein
MQLDEIHRIISDETNTAAPVAVTFIALFWQRDKELGL